MGFVSAKTLVVAALLLCAGSAFAQPSAINYQGRLTENNQAFSGAATMKFAIVDGGATLWSNDGTSVNGSEPSTGVSITLSGGLFAVNLGAQPMQPITPTSLGTASAPQLQIWIRTEAGPGPFVKLSDQPLAAVPYSLTTRQIGPMSNGRLAAWDGLKLVDSSVFYDASSGNTGVGTTSPTATLHIAQSVPTNKVALAVNFAGGNVGSTGEESAIFRVTSSSLFRPLLSLRGPGASQLVYVSPDGNMGLERKP